MKLSGHGQYFFYGWMSALVQPPIYKGHIMQKTKEEILLEELHNQRLELNDRIRNGEEIVSRIRKERKIKAQQIAKSKISKEIWDSWLLKLLKRMEFEGIFYNDIVSIGVDGKRPFGNSYINRDFVEILGWDWQDGKISDEQYHLINQLWEELPIFLNNIIRNL